MLAREVVRSRLESGISFTEFSYVLLQSLDFLELFRHHDVRLQFGGSDQWGNLTGGVELIRRATGTRVHAFATPLMTRADGTKYGKTEGGALWLDPEMMSPYAFYQFWLNVEDAKVGELLRVFTFLSHEEIEDLEAQTAEKPFLRRGSEDLGAARDHDRARGRRRPSRSRRPRPRSSAEVTSGPCTPRPCGRRSTRPAARRSPSLTSPPWSTCSSPRVSPRAAAPPGAPSARAGPT